MEERNKSEWNLALPILALVSFLFIVLRLNPDSIGFDASTIRKRMGKDGGIDR